MMITLLQCIKSARWPDDGPLSILPGVDTDKERQRAKEGKSQPRSLAQIHNISKSALSQVLTTVGVPRGSQPQIDKVLSSLPHLQIHIPNPSALSLTANLTRLNPATNPDYRIYAPKYPKPQSEGFFLIVADTVKDEVLALKRVNWPPAEKVRSSGGNHTSRSIVKLAPETVERKVYVWIISDSYVGMEWRIEGVVVPGVPVLEDDGGKKA
ncbi:hypothetical protein ABVK25_011649 [Lepraria finkii]|uniref:SEC63 domain-containing protein n=1 Tax=Lepraria finkii TaxID=1340010 RepID=A0ABR4ALS1_9LECA